MSVCIAIGVIGATPTSTSVMCPKSMLRSRCQEFELHAPVISNRCFESRASRPSERERGAVAENARTIHRSSLVGRHAALRAARCIDQPSAGVNRAAGGRSRTRAASFINDWSCDGRDTGHFRNACPAGQGVFVLSIRRALTPPSSILGERVKRLRHR